MKGYKFVLVYLFLFPFVLFSCSTSGPGLFGKQSLHEQYANKLESAGLKETALGTLWFAAAEKALNNPVAITLPYKEISYFAAEKPRAVGLQFSGRQGEKLVFEIKKNGTGNFKLFADLWEVSASAKPSLLRSLDTTQHTFDLEIDDPNTRYILRLQPELLKSMDYELSISIAPSLAFPVSGKGARIGSVWGDARDAGARRHEGIDIFAPKRTPAVAAADGTVTAVNENNLGGKVVWLRPQGKNYTLYYAHLDEQLATSGQRVKVGDTVGLVGNTGNARTTPPHLHFGIYSFGGAINPLPFVDPAIKKPPTITAGINLKEDKLRLTRSTELSSGNFAASFAANTVVEPLAVTAKTYRVVLPNEMIAEVPKSVVQEITRPLRQAKLKSDTFLLETPQVNAPRKRPISTAAAVSVLGVFEQFSFVRIEDAEGWVPSTMLQ